MEGDINKMFNTSLWFGSGALAGAIRAEIDGRDYDEIDLLTYGAMGMPVSGLYQTVEGVLNPAVVQQSRDLSDAINIYK
jgi:hypothetical protein